MMLLTSALSALWLATAAHGAVQQDAEGNVKSIGVSSGSSASRHSAHGTNAFFQQLRTHSLNQVCAHDLSASHEGLGTCLDHD